MLPLMATFQYNDLLNMYIDFERRIEEKKILTYKCLLHTDANTLQCNTLHLQSKFHRVKIELHTLFV